MHLPVEGDVGIELDFSMTLSNTDLAQKIVKLSKRSNPNLTIHQNTRQDPLKIWATQPSQRSDLKVDLTPVYGQPEEVEESYAYYLTLPM